MSPIIAATADKDFKSPVSNTHNYSDNGLTNYNDRKKTEALREVGRDEEGT